MKVIQAKGDFRRVGEAVGEATRQDVRAVLEKQVPFLRAHTMLKTEEAMRLELERMYARSEPFFPQAFEYLRGLARGAGLAFDDVLFVMFSEDIFGAHEEKCSTLVVRTAKGWVLGHNEDFDPHYFGRLSVLDLSFDDAPRMLSVSYPGNPPGLGGSLNGRGIAISNNSLWAGAAPGVTKQVRHFKACLATSMNEALEALAAQPVALADHFTVIAAGEHRAASLEVTDEQSADPTAELRELGEAPMAHTNTMRYLKLKVPDGSSENSRQRYEKLAKAAAAHPPGSPEGMLAFLSERDGLLNRPPGSHPTSVTLATVVIRPETGELWVRDNADDATIQHFKI